MDSRMNLQCCTVKDVAKLAGVSTATVSRVVNGTAIVSGKTAAKVLTAISRLKYFPNVHAAQLGRANSRHFEKSRAQSVELS
jgi:LacI family transcriptional regulator